MSCVFTHSFIINNLGLPILNLRSGARLGLLKRVGCQVTTLLWSHTVRPMYWGCHGRIIIQLFAQHSSGWLTVWVSEEYLWSVQHPPYCVWLSSLPNGVPTLPPLLPPLHTHTHPPTRLFLVWKVKCSTYGARVCLCV